MQKSSVSSFTGHVSIPGIEVQNTSVVFAGCSIETLGLYYFFKNSFPVLGIMTLAIINGLITSIILETIILMRQNLIFQKRLTQQSA